MAESGYGRIRLFDDFCGPEIPVANAVAYGTTAGGCNYYLGPYTVRGTLEDTAIGVVSLLKSGGWVRIGGSDENAEGAWVGTEAVFSPSLNGPLALEARVELRILTTTSVFIGFMATLADAAVEPVTSTGTSITYVSTTGIAGFIYDSQLTAGQWHAIYDGGSTVENTTSTDAETGISPVAARSDVLRVEIDTNGTVRWYINGVLERTVVDAVSTTVLLAAGIGSWGTTTTATDIDADFLAVEANRDWTV